MIPCQHKHSIVAENLGFTIQHCLLFQKQCTDEICLACSDRSGEGGEPLVQLEMPTRTPEAITQIYKICQGCPKFNKKDKTCGDLPDLPYPTDILAQNPGLHCPIGNW